MRLILFTFILISNLCHAEDLSSEKAFSEILKCRIEKLKTTSDEISSSAKCYFDKFDEKMTTNEKSQYANWFNSIGKVSKTWRCDGKAEQIATYFRKTNDYVCIEWLDKDKKLKRTSFFSSETKASSSFHQYIRPFHGRSRALDLCLKYSKNSQCHNCATI